MLNDGERVQEKWTRDNVYVRDELLCYTVAINGTDVMHLAPIPSIRTDPVRSEQDIMLTSRADRETSEWEEP